MGIHLWNLLVQEGPIKILYREFSQMKILNWISWHLTRTSALEKCRKIAGVSISARSCRKVPFFQWIRKVIWLILGLGRTISMKIGFTTGSYRFRFQSYQVNIFFTKLNRAMKSVSTNAVAIAPFKQWHHVKILLLKNHVVQRAVPVSKALPEVMAVKVALVSRNFDFMLQNISSYMRYDT